MTDTACNQDIVDAIDRRIGSINTLYALSVTTILIMLLLAVIGYFSVSKTNAILEEFVSEVKLNSKDRTTTALMVQSFNGLTLATNRINSKLDNFIDEQRETNKRQNEHNQRSALLLDDAKTYINQNPIELLRKGK